jgi:hypothetical protein
MMFQYECPRCGTFDLSQQAHWYLESEEFKETRHLLAGVLRNASDSGQILQLTSRNAAELVARAPKNARITSIMDKLLLFVVEQSVASALRAHVVIPAIDYPRYYLRSVDDLFYLAGLLAQQGLVDTAAIAGKGLPVRLTPKGWERGEQLQQTRGLPGQAFVAMWFDSSLDDAFAAGIKPALEASGYTALRIDRVEHNEKIDDRILAEIRRSGLLVADFSNHRGGVYFESGFAMGLGIPVIWTCRESDMGGAHFDTRQYNHITWTTPEELGQKLETRIGALGLARSDSFRSDGT